MKASKKTIVILLAVILVFTFTACGSSDDKSADVSEPIKVATKPMTEQYILGEMLKLLIENDTDYSVEITKGVGGGTNNIQPAMEKGEFDLYPEYTSSGWSMVLGKDVQNMDDDTMFDELKTEYEEKYNMTWVSLYGFNNTFAVGVDKESADKYGLKTCSDLTPVADKLVFGGNPDYFEKTDGFDALCETYDYKFKDVKDIDIGLKYGALKKGDINVTNSFTTDAQLSEDYVVVLEDDKNLQVNYFCSTVVRQDALKKYEGLEDVLMKMDNILTDSEMSELNHKVEFENEDETTVAKDYLISKGLLKA